MWNYFIWNGVSSLDYKIRCSSPDIVLPTRRYSKVGIAGRDGFILSGDSSFEPYTKSVNCQMMDNTQLDNILNWLSGSGKLIFSNEADRFYTASINNEISFDNLTFNSKNFTVKFDCQPYKHDVNYLDDTFFIYDVNKVDKNNPYVFYGKGHEMSRPIIIIKTTGSGQGNISINVNDYEFDISNIDDEIIIDSREYIAYFDDVNMYEKMNGDFPMLNKKGESNNIYISSCSNIEYIKILPYWIYK